MYIPHSMKKRLQDALVKLDDCRAIIEEISDDIGLEDRAEYEDTLNIMSEEMQDWLENIYLIDTEIARWGFDVPEDKQ